MSRVRANTIMDQAGGGAPDCPFGFTANSGTVTGLLTATTYDITDMNVSGAATVSATTVSTSTTTGAGLTVVEELDKQVPDITLALC